MKELLHFPFFLRTAKSTSTQFQLARQGSLIAPCQRRIMLAEMGNLSGRHPTPSTNTPPLVFEM
jgi:hypothetical protein